MTTPNERPIQEKLTIIDAAVEHAAQILFTAFEACDLKEGFDSDVTVEDRVFHLSFKIKK